MSPVRRPSACEFARTGFFMPPLRTLPSSLGDLYPEIAKLSRPKFKLQGIWSYGRFLSRGINWRVHRDDRFGSWPGMPEGERMSWIHLLSALLALGVLVYLVFALLCPEKF
jgi:K+-transporting ATPase ATPase F chain